MEPGKDGGGGPMQPKNEEILGRMLVEKGGAVAVDVKTQFMTDNDERNHRTRDQKTRGGHGVRAERMRESTFRRQSTSGIY